MTDIKKNTIQVLKSVFMVLLCAVIVAVPVLDSYRAYAIAGVDDAALCSIGVAVATGLLIGASMTLASQICTDPYIKQKTAEIGQTVTDGSKKIFRTTVGALKRAKAYLCDRLGIKHDVPTTAATTAEPVTSPNLFQFDFAEYPSSKISYGSDGITVSGISYDASFLADHVIWETANTAKSIDTREDSYYSALQEGFYFTGSTTRSSYEVSSNVIWTLGDLRYRLSASGSTYGSTVRWKVFEPLYFVNSGTGNRELLLSAVMTGISGTSNSTRFFYASTPILDTALNSNATDWFIGTQPPLRAMFGNLNPVVYKTYSQTARNYREYSYEVWTGNAIEATTNYETTTQPPILGGKYDADYDILQKVKDDNAYVNIPITPEIETVAEAIAAGTDYNDLTADQKRAFRDLSKSVYNAVTVGGTTTTTEEVTDGTGAVVTPAVTTVTDAIPLADYLDTIVTDIGEYQGIISRIADTTRSILDTVKSIPQTISETGEYIVDSIDYQLNPNNPKFPEPFIPFFVSSLSSKFPAANDFRSAFNSLSAADSPLVLEYDVVLGSRTYHFSADFSWFEQHRARFRSGVGVMFWLLAWLSVLRGFLSVFHIELGKSSGMQMIFRGAGGSSGATDLDYGGTSSKGKH